MKELMAFVSASLMNQIASRLGTDSMDPLDFSSTDTTITYGEWARAMGDVSIFDTPHPYDIDLTVLTAFV